MAFSWPSGLSGWKDASLSKLLLLASRHYLKDIGEVLDLALDTATRSITVEMLPVGEGESLRISLSGYGLELDATGDSWLTFDTLSTSREWLTRAVARFIPRKRLRLPPGTPVDLLQTLLG